MLSAITFIHKQTNFTAGVARKHKFSGYCDSVPLLYPSGSSNSWLLDFAVSTLGYYTLKEGKQGLLPLLGSLCNAINSCLSIWLQLEQSTASMYV